jgi:hypothetical protein
MAFFSGAATDLAGLLSALAGALLSGGWAQSGSIFSRNGCHVEISVVNVGVGSSTQVVLRCVAGNGESAGALTGRATVGHAIGNTVANTAHGITWPASYSIHVLSDPDEVYMFVNYGVDYWQWLAFGQSGIDGLPGTGNWAGGTFGVPSEGRYQFGHERWPFVVITATTGGGGNQDGPSTALFWNTDGTASAVQPKCATSSFHHGLNGGTWGVLTPAVVAAIPSISRSPSAWNQEAILIPIQPILAMPESKTALIGELGHSRYIRIDNYDPGEVFSLGEDQWRVYPWYRKNSAERSGGNGIDHSGTFGLAIRYDGG